MCRFESAQLSARSHATGDSLDATSICGAHDRLRNLNEEGVDKHEGRRTCRGRGGHFVSACAVIAAAVVGALTLTGCGSSSSAFSARKLASAPSKEWPTNGGSVTNDRYSSLDQITTSNVSHLKGIWHIHLHSGTAPKY